MSALTVEGLAVSATTRTTIGDSAVGVRRRAKSGVMRSHKLGDVRVGQIHTDFMSGDEATILRAILKSPGPVLHGGTLLGADAYFHVSGVQQQPLGADLWVLSWRIEETGFTPSPLLFSFDALAPGAYTFTRTGTAPYTDSDGVLQSAATGVARVGAFADWVDLDGDGIFETPTGLLEPERTNLVTEDDLTAWDTFGTPVVTGGVDDPEGGTGAFTVEDDDGAGSEHIFDVVSFTGDGTKSAVWVVRENVAPSAGSLRLSVWDNTAFANRLVLLVDWVGGEPDVTFVTGSFLGARRLGGGWWALSGQTTSVTAANDHQIHLWPSSDTSGTSIIDVWRANAFDAALPPFSILDASGVLGAEKMSQPPGFTMEDIRRAGGATFYTSWVERGTAYGVGTADRYWQVGNQVRLLLFAGEDGDGTIDGQVRSVGVSLASSSPSAVVPLGKPAEARIIVYLDPADDLWKVQCGVSVEGAAEVLGSAATFGATLPDFDADLMMFAASHNQTVHAPVGLRTIKGIGGVHTMAEMRTIATARLYQRVS